MPNAEKKLVVGALVTALHAWFAIAILNQVVPDRESDDPVDAFLIQLDMAARGPERPPVPPPSEWFEPGNRETTRTSMSPPTLIALEALNSTNDCGEDSGAPSGNSFCDSIRREIRARWQRPTHTPVDAVCQFTLISGRGGYSVIGATISECALDNETENGLLQAAYALQLPHGTTTDWNKSEPIHVKVLLRTDTEPTGISPPAQE